MKMLEVRLATTKTDRENCYRLRHEVFVGEQGVPIELEIDEHDESDAIHFIGFISGEAVAASRIVPVEQVAKIGRLVVVRNSRGQGFGDKMMKSMIDHARLLPGVERVALDAQTYALPFYERLGFKPEGEVFPDAGIEHQHMVLEL